MGRENTPDRLRQLRDAFSLVAVYSLAVLWPLGNGAIYLTTIALGILFFVFCFSVHPKKNLTNSSLIYLTLPLTLSAFMVVVFFQDKPNLYLVNPVASAGLVIALGFVKPIHMGISLWILLAAFGLFLLGNVDVDESIVRIGQNGLTLHFFVLFVVYFFQAHYPVRVPSSTVKKYENYVLAATLFTIAVWSQGRAATVTALICLCAASLVLMRDFSGEKKYWVVLATLFIVSFNYLSPPLMGERPYSAIDRIALNGFSDIRYKVWADYFQTLHLEGVLMGNRHSNCHNILQGYQLGNCNVHSSYLRAHQAYGLLGIFTILAVIFWCLKSLVQQDEWPAVFVVFALLLRVATDESFFTSPYLFALIFICAKVSQREHFGKELGGSK